MFLGVFLLLLGLSIIIRILFKIDVPLVRITFACFLIYMGIRMITGMGCGNSRHHIFSTFMNPSKLNESTDSHGEKSYSTVFGKSRIDLTARPGGSDEKSSSLPRHIEIHSVFGETTVLINPKIATRIKATSVFGIAEMPDGSSVPFGTLFYKTQPQANETLIEIEGNSVFGVIKFIAQEAPAPQAAPAKPEKKEESED